MPPGDFLNAMNVTISPKCLVSVGSSHMPYRGVGRNPYLVPESEGWTAPLHRSSVARRGLDITTAVGLSEAQLQTNGDQMLGGSSDRRSDLSVHPLGRFT